MTVQKISLYISTQIVLLSCVKVERRYEIICNKHTESIAKAIQVPHRPQQIEICEHYFDARFNKEQLKLLRPLIVF